MATEAQRLIGISLAKIAQSRVHRGGVSLHKNLLVATVLQKARYIFMEEAYHMVHGGGFNLTASAHVPPAAPQPPQNHQQRTYEDTNTYEEDNLVALTAEEAGLTSSETLEDTEESATRENFLQSVNCVRCTEDSDKENSPPPPPSTTTYLKSEMTYIDLDKSSTTGQGIKRRRAVSEWETEEAVLSILPKRLKQESETTPEDDSVFLDEAALFSDCVAREVAAAEEGVFKNSDNEGQGTMEIDRITSLVSIFSFGGLSPGGGVSVVGDVTKLSRSMSTPDLCSSQAKDSDNIQQRPFLAMTV